VARGQPVPQSSQFIDEDCVICLGFGIEPLASLPASSALRSDPHDVGPGPLEAFCLSSENHVAHRKCILRWWAERQKSRENGDGPAAVGATTSVPLRMSSSSSGASGGAQIYAEIRREAPFAWRLQLVRGARATPWGIGRVDHVTLVPALRRRSGGNAVAGDGSDPGIGAAGNGAAAGSESGGGGASRRRPSPTMAEEEDQQVRIELLNTFYNHRSHTPWYADFTSTEASRLLRFFGAGKAIGTVIGPSCPVCRRSIGLELAVASPPEDHDDVSGAGGGSGWRRGPRSMIMGYWVVDGIAKMLKFWSRTLGPPDWIGKFSMHVFAVVMLHLGTKSRIKL
jgi:hypothetical protein